MNDHRLSFLRYFHEIFSDPPDDYEIQKSIYYNEGVEAAKRLVWTKEIDETVCAANSIYRNRAIRGVAALVMGKTETECFDKRPTSEIFTGAIFLWAYLWAHYGFNIYRIDENLLSMLLLTEPPMINAKALHFPIPAFRFFMPRGFIKAKEESNHGTRWFDTLDFVLSYKVPSDKYLQVKNSIRENKSSDVFPLMKEKWIIILRNTRDDPENALCMRLYMDIDDDPIKLSISLFDDVDGDDYDKRLMVCCLRILINFILMLQNKIITPHRVEKNYPESRRHGIERPHDFVFPHRRVQENLKRMAKESCLMTHKRTAWQVKMKFLVNGFWRNQAYGKRWSERRRKWIEPFWKGPETADGYMHLYDNITCKKDESKEKP